jgi:hypothetical protein
LQFWCKDLRHLRSPSQYRDISCPWRTLCR